MTSWTTAVDKLWTRSANSPKMSSFSFPDNKLEGTFSRDILFIILDDKRKTVALMSSIGSTAKTLITIRLLDKGFGLPLLFLSSLLTFHSLFYSIQYSSWLYLSSFFKWFRKLHTNRQLHSRDCWRVVIQINLNLTFFHEGVTENSALEIKMYEKTNRECVCSVFSILRVFRSKDD